MAKKELPTTIRTMQGFSPGIYRDTPKGLVKERDLPEQPIDKDAIIAELRASLAILKAKEAGRLTASREAMRKKRAKTKP